MIDISKGRFWDLPWSLVDGCTPCSLGCDHCWALAMEKRFRPRIDVDLGVIVDDLSVITHPERLAIPLKRRKPTVYAIWNDLFHEDVPDEFRMKTYFAMNAAPQHTYLILTKRPIAMGEFTNTFGTDCPIENGGKRIWHGLTVCNQPEADAKMGDFLQVPGKKFLSIEPMLGPVDIRRFLPPLSAPSCVNCHFCNDEIGCNKRPGMCSDFKPLFSSWIDAVILGGETGPGARPMHPDWVRSVRDQCAAVGVPFFFKGWGNKLPEFKACIGATPGSYEALTMNIVKRLLDGRTHDELPWRKP